MPISPVGVVFTQHLELTSFCRLPLIAYNVSPPLLSVFLSLQLILIYSFSVEAMLQIAGSVSYIAQLNQCYVMNYVQLSQYRFCIRSIPLGWKHCATKAMFRILVANCHFHPVASVEGRVIIMQAFECKMHVRHSILHVYIYHLLFTKEYMFKECYRFTGYKLDNHISGDALNWEFMACGI